MSKASPELKPKPKRQTRHSPWRKARKRIFRSIGGPLVRLLGPIALRLYSRTWRHKVSADHPDHIKALQEDGGLAILWHGRGFSLIPLFRGTNVSILVSHSKDGQIMGQMLRGFGFDTIDGSSSKGGARAMRSMMRVLKSGRTICFTPDGPRGPLHSISPAVVFISRSTGYPIIPVGLGVNRAWRMNTWDRYTIPKPFSTLVSHIGAPIQVPRDVTEQEQKEWDERIQKALLDAERRAFEEAGAEIDW